MKLIDKDTLLVEIKRKRNDYINSFMTEQVHVLNDVLDFLNNLEVKEVDFSTEIYKYIDEHFNVYDDGNQTLQTKDKKSLIGRVDVENIATHFFKLGIGVSNKTQKGE